MSRPCAEKRSLKLWLGTATSILSYFLIITPIVFAAVPSFEIRVPNKVMPQLQIQKLKVTVSVETTAAVTFKITNAHGQTFETPPLTPSAPPLAHPFPSPGPPAARGDVIFINPPDLLPGSDPAGKKYVFLLNLESDLDTASFCADTMAADETWKIEVTAGPQIDGVCVQSIDSNIPGNVCGASFRPVPLPPPPANPAQHIATVIGQPGSLQGCRPGIDAVLVLDRSGSMSSPVQGGTDPTLLKIQSLHKSVKSFVQVWDVMRANESSMSASPPIQSPEDKIGVVFFDHEVNWLKEIVPASTIDGLKPFSSTTKADIDSNVPLVGARGLTSIGGGLKKGAEAFTPVLTDGNRKVILLMSDGMQNTDPLAQVIGTQVQTTVGAVPTNLANQPPLQIYSVTVGTGAVIDPTINQNLATASGGFYINSETEAGILPAFFLEVLQNFLKYGTVETLRMVSEKTRVGAPYQTTIPVTTTTQSITFNLTWNAQLGRLRLTVQPPGGVPPIVRTPGRGDTSGTLLLNQLLPIKANQSSGGDWVVTVEPVGEIIEIKARERAGEIPFNLMVLGDDMALNSELTAVAADYAPGDQIRLQASVNEFEQPIVGLGSQPGAQVLVKLVRPGVSLGDVLSDSTASASPQPGPDPLTAANTKLQNTLQDDPSVLVRNEDTIMLLDNGDAANGDAVAGDGIYSALFPAQFEGHHNFLFAVEGAAQNLGRFSRQQLRTVHVRSVPDAATTEILTSVQQIQDGNRLNINLTPRTKFGHRMGLGWCNYFWFTSPGRPAFKGQDNLNGTCTAGLNFSGAIPPVTLHFLRVSAVINDSVTADQLPVPLGGGTVLVPTVPGTGKGHEHPWLRRCFQTKASLGGFTLVAGLVALGFIAYLPGARRE